MRRLTLLLVGLAILLPLATAHAGEAEFNSTAELITQGHPCSELTTEQLVAIGDYYMEQMHPGEQHELMDAHLGGENTTAYRDAHLAMADRFYCDTVGGSSGTWDWMPMHGTWSGMWGGMMTPFGGLFWFATWILVLLGIVYLGKQLLADREAEEDGS